jgi:crotonobetainyl-CoA:carnitine CoA-transferase CaiB-like acyl-CoA transferase
MLNHLRVLDLTQQDGYLCSRILADLGCDVIKIEPPGGDPGREVGPYVGGVPDKEGSLYWFAYNANKRGITLDLKAREGQELLRQLVRSADFVVESFPPGYLTELGVGYEQLRAENESLIYVSITPFGQDGPYAGYKGSDLVVTALSGYLFLCGNPDEPPVRISFPQVSLMASAEAAAAALIALHGRSQHGFGTSVDVAALESSAWLQLMVPIASFLENKRIIRRQGQRGTNPASGSQAMWIWRCKDGNVDFRVFGGAIGSRTMRSLLQWMEDERFPVDAFLHEFSWEQFDFTTASQEFLGRIEPPIQAFLLLHTKVEVLKESIARNLLMKPVLNPADILGLSFLEERRFWETVEHPKLDHAIKSPGSFLRTGQPTIRRRAPLIGEHNREVYCEELGLTPTQLEALSEVAVV